jgi:hypothetical protein
MAAADELGVTQAGQAVVDAVHVDRLDACCLHGRQGAADAERAVQAAVAVGRLGDLV